MGDDRGSDNKARRGEGKLTALMVQRHLEPGRYVDGRGLMLYVQPSGSRSWVLRAQHAGRRRDYGLGGYPELGLADAREKASQFRTDVRAGRDVVALKQPRPELETFQHAAERMLSALMDGGKLSPKTASKARQQLRDYAFPKLGKLQLQSITADTLAAALEPIWLKKPETARRARANVIRVLRFALPNGAMLETALAKAVTDRLPRQPRAEHHAAMPHADIAPFMAMLAERNGIGALALQFTILTAARSGETRGAAWAEIDLEGAVWTIPASRMKMHRPHRVPLSRQAVAVLERVVEISGRTDGLVFPSANGGQLSDMTLTKIMRDTDTPYVVHGFRSSFSDWRADATTFAPELAEAALSHAVPDPIAAAYKRTDFFDKRRAVMRAWGDYCVEGNGAKVVAFKAGRRANGN